MDSAAFLTDMTFRCPLPQLPTQHSSSSSEEESDEDSDDEEEDAPPAKDHTTDAPLPSQSKHVQFSEQVDDLTDTPFAKRTCVRTGFEDGVLTDTPKSVSLASGRNSHGRRNARLSLESLKDTPDQRQKPTKTRKRLRPAAARGDGDKHSESNKSPRKAKDRVKQRMEDKYSNPFLDLEAVNDDETDTEDEEGIDDGSSHGG